VLDDRVLQGELRVSEVLVLSYHAVSPAWPAPLSVTPEALESQLAFLVDRGFRGATFTEAVLDPPHPRTLAVTFDDGFLSVLERAAPILHRFGLPGTVFVPTAFMERRQLLLWKGVEHWADTPFAEELRGMSWTDLAALVGQGWEVGSHTRTHPRLTQLDQQHAYTELAGSRLECERKLGRMCASVAYPYGAVDRSVADTASRAGYLTAARLTSNLSPRGALRWPRVGIYHKDAAWRFRLKASTSTRRLRATSLWPSQAPT
jgi:peptidoglycan/xylan/chitin deacetylase (PgdA/CDA1 family)